ncbi:MAG: sterol desaturase family protein [Agitococcus sp.]|nr:sterol desaturase family protein [Agitococcus sp.]
MRVERDIVRKPHRLVGAVVTDTHQLLHSDGALHPGAGMIGSVLGLVLGFLSLLGVLAFMYPQYLTTPELRHAYSVAVCRYLLFTGLFVAGALALCNILLDRYRTINIGSFAMVLLAVAMGGSKVPVGAFPDHTPYLGLDWFILDLLGSTTIFVMLEKLFPLYTKQQVFRKEWQTDLVHFCVNHLLVGLFLLIVNYFIHRLLLVIGPADFQAAIANIPFFPQLLLCLLVADLAEYGAHRAYHEVSFLWRFHAVHHSAKIMDWIAGSRQHTLELILTRVCVLAPLFALGLEKSVIDTYILIVGFQAVFNHANVHLPWGPLKYLIVTPDFHHWHHSSDAAAIDKNYAAHFAFIDYLFGTAVKTDKAFPEKYGVVGDYMPNGFLKQQAHPFKKR